MTCSDPIPRDSVLIVERHKLLASSISKELLAQGVPSRTTESGLAALGELARGGVSLLILGDESGGMEAIELCGVFRADPRAAELPILVMSARRDEQDRIAAFQNGATDVVSKPLSVREVALRVRAILKRQSADAVASSYLRVGEIDILIDQYQVRVSGKSIQLTRQEMRLLTAMAKQRGRAFTRDEILDLVWDGSKDVMERTVDAHVKGLRAKLGPAASQIETVRGVGYRLSASEPEGERHEGVTKC
ncbi:MAG: response regulator transcription factor [Myxococcota bacterium]|jgi:DNA-binding response OmpR family regulator|nr:response regulator transcription factor [Myxococcota bacterium]